MAEKVLIFGTNACPYTTAAREDYAKKGYDVEYVNVTATSKRYLGWWSTRAGGASNPLWSQVARAPGEILTKHGNALKQRAKTAGK